MFTFDPMCKVVSFAFVTPHKHKVKLCFLETKDIKILRCKIEILGMKV